jgi:hypothetical protein
MLLSGASGRGNARGAFFSLELSGLSHASRTVVPFSNLGKPLGLLIWTDVEQGLGLMNRISIGKFCRNYFAREKALHLRCSTDTVYTLSLAVQ